MTYPWTMDELARAGEEHLDAELAERFDERMPFDASGDVELLLERGLTDEDVVVEFGAGTGSFALEVAPHCERVVAVDVSDAMLDVLRGKLERADLDNVETERAGFLSYEHEGEPASLAYSKDALHHLPDFWKLEALTNVGATLRDGGVLRLSDFVLSFDPRDSEQKVESYVEDKCRNTEFSREEVDRHFREEFSTYGFLLEPLIERAGYEVTESCYTTEFHADYVCRWSGARE